MADFTSNLLLPFLAEAQAQKHVTINETLFKLDALVHTLVQDVRAAPPASPVEGLGYLANAPTGAWTGKNNNVIFFQDGVWRFYPPHAGWLVLVASTDTYMTYKTATSTWEAFVGGGGGSTTVTQGSIV
jgi:Protein of unknown function (DUF2793)